MSERARIIGVVPLPIPLDQFGDIAKAYPKDSTVSQHGAFMLVRSPGEQCRGCVNCEAADGADFDQLHGDAWVHFQRYMIVCPDCGNKRCPRATQHDLACTGSNEPGQEGSVYA